MSKMKELQRTLEQRDAARGDAAAFARGMLAVIRALGLSEPENGERLDDIVARCIGQIEQLHRRAAELEQAVEMHLSTWRQLADLLDMNREMTPATLVECVGAYHRKLLEDLARSATANAELAGALAAGVIPGATIDVVELKSFTTGPGGAVAGELLEGGDLVVRIPAAQEVLLEQVMDEVTELFHTQRCRVCGCTQDRACETDNGPCDWAEVDLCTACLVRFNPEIDRLCEHCDATLGAGEPDDGWEETAGARDGPALLPHVLDAIGAVIGRHVEPRVAARFWRRTGSPGKARVKARPTPRPLLDVGEGET